MTFQQFLNFTPVFRVVLLQEPGGAKARVALFSNAAFTSSEAALSVIQNAHTST
jgi:CHASE1-domain containing sensor protein